MPSGPRVGVDVGGTFTDVVLVADGERTTVKVPSTTDPAEGVLAGVETACERAGVSLPAVGEFRHASTVAVNALLEGTGGEAALVTTEGFADVLAIRRQNRPDLYDRAARHPDPLVPRERRYEVPERATPEGIEAPVDEDAVRAVAAEIEADAVAVAFLHADAHPANERRAVDVLEDELDVPVRASHAVVGEHREFERTATTAADAVLAPAVGGYLDRLAAAADERGLPTPRVMQADGGIADAPVAARSPIRTVFSGPAAGVVGAGAFARPGSAPNDRTSSADATEAEAGAGAGTDAAEAEADTPFASAGTITLDMGGTSCDVSLLRGPDPERTRQTTVGGHPLRIPAVDVATVGAGGGSVASVDAGGALTVGPESAGADPGPACYDRGGSEPTVTDAALQTGRLGADATLGENLSLAPERARETLADLAAAADLAGPDAAADGVLRVATATMARAVRRVTVERGHDPRAMTLAAFGGAGPMVAARIADLLDVRHVVVPPAGGVLSAFGLLVADETHEQRRTHRVALPAADHDRVGELYDSLAAAVREDCSRPGEATVERRAACRYEGQRHELEVPVPTPFDAATVRERFAAAHDRERGFRMDDAAVEMTTLVVRARIAGETPRLSHRAEGPAVVGERPVRFDGLDHATTVYDRSGLPSGDAVEGPAVVRGGQSTAVCPPDWRARVDERGALHLEGER